MLRQGLVFRLVAQRDLYDWLLLGTSATGVLTVFGGVAGYWRKVAAERRAQAEAFYIVTELDGGTGLPLDERQVRYVLINGSERIVSEVILKRPDEGAFPVGVVEPGRHMLDVPNGQDATALLYWPHPVACSFRDAHGREWFRDDRGTLFRASLRSRIRLAARAWVMRRRLAWRRRKALGS